MDQTVPLQTRFLLGQRLLEVCFDQDFQLIGRFACWIVFRLTSQMGEIRPALRSKKRSVRICVHLISDCTCSPDKPFEAEVNMHGR